MNPSFFRLFLGAALALLSVGTAFAGGRGNGNHSSPSSGFAARPAARSNAGVRFSPAAVRHWNTGGNFRRVTPLNRVSNFNRHGVRSNSASHQSGNIIRNGNARWNGNHHGQWANHHNGIGHWRRCGNRYVFIWDYGYPWYFPYSYSYYDSYYPYGGYPVSYSNYESGNSYVGQVYEGNNVDQDYASSDDQGTNADNASVAEVQRSLARAGFYKGAIDGAMGSRTYYAIRAYQRSRHLQVDGEIGPELLNSLGRR